MALNVDYKQTVRYDTNFLKRFAIVGIDGVRKTVSYGAEFIGGFTSTETPIGPPPVGIVLLSVSNHE